MLNISLNLEIGNKFGHKKEFKQIDQKLICFLDLGFLSHGQNRRTLIYFERNFIGKVFSEKFSIPLILLSLHTGTFVKNSFHSVTQP